ncbi:MAG: ABC transporter permease [Paramuribaculum sp.]|nr:ABC transporter permease [Paramuribaculum sp.]MDE6489148.1 ABC transporter permease [Paramuribaculum sp.]
MDSKTSIIIGREYMERVSKKSFLITTFLMPVLMLGMMMVPALIAMFSESENRQLMVIDNSGKIAQELKNTPSLTFVATGIPLDSARNLDGVDGVLVIPAEVLTGQATMQIYTNGPSSMEIESAIVSQVDDIVERYKLSSYEIENLDRIIESIKSDVKLQSIRNDKDSTESSTTLSYLLGIVLTMMLYMCLILYGQMVMTSIIEEKNNRVLEIVVSSVRPTQLMLGKICGIGLVAVTQIVIWGVLMVGMSAFLLPVVLPETMSAEMAALSAGGNTASLTYDVEMLQAVSMLGNISYIIELFGLLLLFLIGGFMLYSAVYAAIGSAVDNIQDAGQLQSVVVFPIVVGIAVAMAAASDPASTLSLWTSFIPFTSPMVMMARIPFGIPAWEIVVSLLILFASFFAVVWVAAKIYRVGIFMYGKKPSFAELIKWIRYN